MCADQLTVGLRDRVEVMTTLPFASPEYILSLSSEQKRVVTGFVCVRRT